MSMSFSYTLKLIYNMKDIMMTQRNAIQTGITCYVLYMQLGVINFNIIILLYYIIMIFSDMSLDKHS